MQLETTKLNELKKLMSYILGEKDINSGVYPCEVVNLGNTYINANLRWAGHVEKWRTTKDGKKENYTAENYDFIAGDSWGKPRPVTCCRICGLNIKPYERIYLRKINEGNGDFWFMAYGSINSYCETCAQGEEAKENKPIKSPQLLREYKQKQAGDKYETRVMEFEGFTIQSNDAWKRKK